MSVLTKVDYGKKLRLLRTSIYAKQSDIASKLNISQQAYSHLENGRTHFSVTIIHKICDVFHISFQEFMTLNAQSLQLANSANDSFTMRILQAHYKKMILERDLRIVQLELELKKYKKHKTPSIDTKSSQVYVMI